MYMAHSPCFIISPCFLLSSVPFCPHSYPFYLIGTLLAVTGSVHLVPRLLVNLLPISLPWLIYPSFQNPNPPEFPTPNIHSLGRQCEPSSQDRAQGLFTTTCFKGKISGGCPPSSFYVSFGYKKSNI